MLTRYASGRCRVCGPCSSCLILQCGGRLPGPTRRGCSSTPRCCCSRILARVLKGQSQQPEPGAGHHLSGGLCACQCFMLLCDLSAPRIAEPVSVWARRGARCRVFPPRVWPRGYALECSAYPVDRCLRSSVLLRRGSCLRHMPVSYANAWTCMQS